MAVGAADKMDREARLRVLFVDPDFAEPSGSHDSGSRVGRSVQFADLFASHAGVVAGFSLLLERIGGQCGDFGRSQPLAVDLFVPRRSSCDAMSLRSGAVFAASIKSRAADSLSSKSD